MTLLHLLDLLSTFIFALVGARVAADKGLDYGGIALPEIHIDWTEMVMALAASRLEV